MFFRHFFPAGLAALAFSTAAAHADFYEDCVSTDLPTDIRLEACNAGMISAVDTEDMVDWLLDRGVTLYDAGRMAASEVDFRTAAFLDPQSALAASNVYIMLANREAFEEALTWAERAYDLSPDDPEILADLIVALTDTGQSNQCGPIADRLLSVFPSSEQRMMEDEDWAYFTHAPWCYDMLEQTELALEHYSVAVDAGHAPNWILDNMASLLVEEGRDIEAGKIAASLIAIDGPTPRLVAYQVNGLLLQDDLEAALSLFEIHRGMLRASDDDWGAYNIVAWDLFLAGRIEEASQIIEEWNDWASDLSGPPPYTLAFAYDTLAHVRAALGDTQGAGDAFVASLADAPDVVRTFYRSALIDLGIPVAPGETGLMTALRVCASRGPECRLIR